MKLFVLVTEAMLPIPDTIETKSFGKEYLITDDGMNRSSGDSVFINGPDNVVMDWLEKFDKIWTSTNPMMGWEQISFKKDSELLRIPRSTFLQFKKEYKNMDKSLRFGQAFHQWFKLEKITSDQNKAWADKLYVVNAAQATKMIESILDYAC